MVGGFRRKWLVGWSVGWRFFGFDDNVFFSFWRFKVSTKIGFDECGLQNKIRKIFFGRVGPKSQSLSFFSASLQMYNL